MPLPPVVYKRLRQYSPQLIPFTICLVLIPFASFLSIIAGLTVWHNVAVGWQVPLYLQYGDGIPPYTQIQLPPLVSQQPYDIHLHLVAPANENNFGLGNFMSSLTLTNAKNRTIAYVRRPSIALPPRSYFWSRKRNTVDIKIPLLASYTPGTSFVNAFVEVGRKDGWKAVGSGEGRELSVYSASLQGIVSHQGFRGLITRFPLITSFISSGLFFTVLLAIVGVCVLPTAIQRQPRSETDKLAIEDDASPKPLPVKSDDEEPIAPRPTRRKSRSSRSGSRRTSLKIEDEGFTDISLNPPFNPLRKRQSVGPSGDSSDLI